ncbi:MAG: acyltransferase [Salinibacterium sp.]|nr:acyltransferase [Salinibacterium sp.]MBF0672929.1 acyltransferase [Salinibacterium sp.]
MSAIMSAVRSITSVRTYLHGLRIAHFYSYSHARQLGRLGRGEGVTFAPNVSFRNAERIWLGDGTHIGERSLIWAGDSTGQVRLGTKCLLAPGVMLTASNYSTAPGVPIMDQAKVERDILLGDDVWLGANVVVTAGVTIGSGCIVGAGAVVTRDLPPGSIAAGVPARVIGHRGGEGAEPAASGADDAVAVVTPMAGRS